MRRAAAGSRLDREGQFSLTYGANLSEALCWGYDDYTDYTDYTDERYGGLVEQCRSHGVTHTVDEPAAASDSGSGSGWSATCRRTPRCRPTTA